MESSAGGKPHAIVSIDMGATFLKSAYAVLLGKKYVPEFFNVDNWQNNPDLTHTWVPTALAYPNPDDHRGPLAAGYAAVDPKLTGVGAPAKLFSLFKKSFPSGKCLSSGGNGDDYERLAFDLYVEFLRSVYTTIEKHYNTHTTKVPKWAQANIVFVFSVPVTPPQDQDAENFGERLLDAARFAGFCHHRGHTLAPCVPEPVATAIFCLTDEEFRGKLKSAEQNVLVADIGGATSDFCLFNLRDGSKVNAAVTVPLRGNGLGSTSIDAEFEYHFSNYLKRFDSHAARAESLARAFTRNAFFERSKHLSEIRSRPNAHGFLRLGPLERNLDRKLCLREHDGFKVANGDVWVHPLVMKTIVDFILGIATTSFHGIRGPFDTIIECLFVEQDNTSWWHKKRLNGHLGMIVFAGGFGSSGYLTRRIKEELPMPSLHLTDDEINLIDYDYSITDTERCALRTRFHRNVADLEYYVIPDAESVGRMCVAHGLLLHQIQLLTGGERGFQQACFRKWRRAKEFALSLIT